MKKILLVLSFFVFNMKADARHPHKASRLAERNTPGTEILRGILAEQLSMANVANKGTGALKRIKGHNYVENGVLEDTTYYVYSGDRGSTHPVFSSYYGYYMPATLGSRQYIQCDTMHSMADYSGQGNLYENYYSYTYDSKGNVIYCVTGYSSFGYAYDVSYNSGNQPIMLTNIDISGSTPVPTGKMYIFYNSNGQRQMDSSYNLQTNMPSSKREYVFDGAGNHTGYFYYVYKNNQWELSLKTIYTYDNNSRVVTSVTDYDGGSGITPSNKDSFGYTGTANQYTHYSTYKWDIADNEWVPEEMQTYVLNTAGMIDTYYINEWDGSSWDTTEMDIYTYKDGLMVRTNGYNYTGGGVFSSTPYDQMDYYFEEYYTSGIDVAGKTDMEVVLYPNPAVDRLFVEGRLENYSISVLNGAGQVIYTERNLNGNKEIPTGAYPQGTYWVNIKDAEGRIYTEEFIKQ